VLVAALAAAVLTRGDDEPPVPATLPVDAWAPYWVLQDSTPELALRAPSLRELSPFWYTAVSADSVIPDPNAPGDELDAFMAAARRTGVPLVPSIFDAMPTGGMAAVLADPTSRRTHIETLVDFAASGDFAGLDLDYEQFAYADDRSTWEATRPNWVAFVSELAERLHADGRTLGVSIPPVYDDGRTDESGYWVYDYGGIAPVVDRIRVMAYDYSTADAGPIAPLDWVRTAVEGTAEASGAPEKLVLGIPLYGYNWPTTTFGTCPPAEDVGRTSVTIRNVADLVALRGATPVYDAVTGEWSFGYDLVIDDGATACTQRRQVNYVDSDGARLRIDMAREAGFGGVSLWALGYDDDSLWAAIEPVITG
jgi:spore germination protein YaaH